MNGDFPFYNVLLHFSDTSTNFSFARLKQKLDFSLTLVIFKLLGLFKHSFETSFVSLSNF